MRKSFVLAAALLVAGLMACDGASPPPAPERLHICTTCATFGNSPTIVNRRTLIYGGALLESMTLHLTEEVLAGSGECAATITEGDGDPAERTPAGLTQDTTPQHLVDVKVKGNVAIISATCEGLVAAPTPICFTTMTVQRRRGAEPPVPTTALADAVPAFPLPLNESLHIIGTADRPYFVNVHGVAGKSLEIVTGAGTALISSRGFAPTRESDMVEGRVDEEDRGLKAYTVPADHDTLFLTVFVAPGGHCATISVNEPLPAGLLDVSVRFWSRDPVSQATQDELLSAFRLVNRTIYQQTAGLVRVRSLAIRPNVTVDAFGHVTDNLAADDFIVIAQPVGAPLEPPPLDHATIPPGTSDGELYRLILNRKLGLPLECSAPFTGGGCSCPMCDDMVTSQELCVGGDHDVSNPGVGTTAPVACWDVLADALGIPRPTSAPFTAAMPGFLPL